MGANEKFCLRWNDFESNISVAFREIREEKDLLDCTLSCGSRQIQAHKLILSACSPFFRSILRQNPHQHPLLYLKGVGFNELQSVLSFMYHGEVNIGQDELNSFLSVAEELQVKGLTQNTAKSHTKPELSPPQAPRLQPTQRQSDAAQISKRVRPQPVPAVHSPIQPAYQQPQEDEIQELPAPIKIEPQPVAYPSTSVAISAPVNEVEGTTMSTEVASMEESYDEEGYEDYGRYDGQEYEGQGYGGNADGGQKDLNSFVLKTGSGFTCTECGKEFNDKSNCRRHVKISHNLFVGELSCEYCHKTYKNNYALKDHLRKTHGVYNNAA